MANELEKSIFFAGGKILAPESNDINKGLRFERLADGSWQVTLNLKISSIEAAGVLNKFDDFLKDGQPVPDLDKDFPNQVFFEAFDAASNSIDIQVQNVKLYVLNSHKTQEGGSIFFTMTPPNGVGKTQNSGTKTQNAETQAHPQ